MSQPGEAPPRVDQPPPQQQPAHPAHPAHPAQVQAA